MKKRVVSIALILVLCLTLCVPTRAADSYSNFTKKHTYTEQFADVASAAWFADYVKMGYEYGLIQGSSATQFSPDTNLTIAQAITLAVRVHSTYTTGSALDEAIPTGGQWFDPYVTYALANNVISSAYDDYNAAATRSQVAVIFAGALPSEALAEIRTVKDNAIPDVAMSASYASAVYQLYRAGILSGSDAGGTFYPDSNIKRSEIAAICVRLAIPSQRQSAEIGFVPDPAATLTAEQIAEKCSPAVFFIDIYGFNGAKRATGSGFFISSDGLAITNYHVAANSSKLEIRLTSGKTYNDVTIIDADKANDLALLRVNGTGFPYLEMGDSSTVKQGQQVYAIGSPLGLDNTLSQGIISNVKRVINNIPFIQISVPIAPGSSGGALVDTHGRVVAVTQGALSNSTGDLNLAVPINLAKALDKNSTKSLICIRDIFYPGFTQALDFGAFSGVELLGAIQTPLGYTLQYDASDFYDVFDFEAAECFAYTIYYYSQALQDMGLVLTNEKEFFGGIYESSTETVLISGDLTESIYIVVIREPQYYKEFSKLVDFGWYSGISLDGPPTKIDESTIYTYNWADYYTVSGLSQTFVNYFDLLEMQGYQYKGGDDSSCLFEGNGLSIVIIHDTKYVYIDVQAI